MNRLIAYRAVILLFLGSSQLVTVITLSRADAITITMATILLFTGVALIASGISDLLDVYFDRNR